MTWKDLTIEQAQEVYKIIKDNSLNEIEQEIKAVCYLLEEDETEVNTWSLEKYKEAAKKVAFIHLPIPEQKPPREFRVNGKRYFVCYDMKQVSFGQYNEIMAFSKGEDYLIHNLHLLMATIVKQVKGFSIFKHYIKNKDHDKVSEDMKQAPFLLCHHATVFFYQVYKECLKNIQPYLITELMNKGMTSQTATETITALLAVLDGYAPQSK